MSPPRRQLERLLCGGLLLALLLPAPSCGGALDPAAAAASPSAGTRTFPPASPEVPGAASLALEPPRFDLEDLRRQFAQPPKAYRPWVLWHWMDGNITREGISADLEAMQRVGIGGAIVVDITHEIPPGPVRFMSEEWRSLFRHAVREAERWGLEIGVHNAPGWCGSGGPWVEPDWAMRKVVCSWTNLTGPARFEDFLPPLTKGTRLPPHDAVVLAFPAIAGDGAHVPGFKPRITASEAPSFEGGHLLDGNPATAVRLTPPTRRPAFLQLAFDEPFAASYLSATVSRATPPFEGAVQVSDNGRSFRTVREFMCNRSELSVEFPEVSARYFRFVITRAMTAAKPLEIAELDLGPRFRIPTFSTKAGMGRMHPVDFVEPWRKRPVPDYGRVDPAQVVDLTDRMDPAGRLTWNVPAGLWTVLRVGHAPTGRTNNPARPEARGLECDKLSRDAAARHFAAFVAKLADEAGPAAGRVFSTMFIDSWEVGFQNWTPGFREEFHKRRGYDPLPWLPAMTGRVVAGAEESERFLWDIRRTIADLQAEHYAAHMVQLARARGLQVLIQGHGNGPFDNLLYGAQADVPMSEFWTEKDDFSRHSLSKSMASAAHTAGRRRVAAEAFTAYPQDATWQNHPYGLKALGDGMYCAGVNWFVFHRFAHQPWLDRKPGMAMGQWGIQYERTQTWWDFSKPWHEYLARCQLLLQTGRFVADVCYLTTESAFASPPSTGDLDPSLPPGYDYDVIHPRLFMDRMSASNGWLTLPDGMGYRVLALPPVRTMTPALLRKLRDLVASGATVVGPPPLQSPSLADFPQADNDVKNMAKELWGDTDGHRVRDHRFGKGRVVWGKPLQEVLADLGIPPDFEQLAPVHGIPLRHIHRRVGDADIYFVANSNSHPVTAECKFRVTGKAPELWDPETGRSRAIPAWRSAGSHTLVPLALGPAGSAFVVFHKPAREADPVSALHLDGRPRPAADLEWGPDNSLELTTAQPGEYSLTTAKAAVRRASVGPLPKPMEITGPWTVQFPSNSGAPTQIRLDQLISWTGHSDPGVKYFSGTATYSTTFELPSDFAGPDRLLRLDLGRVAVIARVLLNEQDLGIVWKPPFEVEVTKAAVPGPNRLEIQVANLWVNRLIGDEFLPEDCEWRPAHLQSGRVLANWPQWLVEGKPSPTGRITFTPWKCWSKDSPLLESGLLGPVRLQALQRAAFR
jgi:hypothetical protein